MSVAADVADALGLERVLWIPARIPPHKRRRAMTAADLRLAMVRAATAADPRFEVCTLELDRPGPSYTVDTARMLRSEHPEDELYLILGADQATEFDTWREPDRIVELVRLAIMNRGDKSGEDATTRLPSAAEVVVVPVRSIELSSSEVRRRVAAGGDIDGLVPPAVRAIIERERLYSTP